MWQLLGQDLDHGQTIYKPTHSPKYILAQVSSNWMFLNVASSGVIWTLVTCLATLFSVMINSYCSQSCLYSWHFVFLLQKYVCIILCAKIKMQLKPGSTPCCIWSDIEQQCHSVLTHLGQHLCLTHTLNYLKSVETRFSVAVRFLFEVHFQHTYLTKSSSYTLNFSFQF